MRKTRTNWTALAALGLVLGFSGPSAAQDAASDSSAQTAEDVDAQEARLRAQIEAAPTETQAGLWVDLARLLESDGRIFDAAYAWGQARKLRGTVSDAGGEARVLLDFAERVLVSGDAGAVIKAAFVDAEIALERARKLGLREDWALIGLARCAAALGSPDKQIRLLELTLAEHPRSVAAERALAFACYHAGEHERAGAVFDRLIARGRNDLLNLTLTRCASARELGDEATAVRAAEQAIHAAPTDDRGWLALWQIYKGERRFGELADRLIALASGHPESAAGAHYAGFACSSAGRTVVALAWLGKAVRAKPKNVSAHLEIARLLREDRNDAAGAVERYRTVLELSPGNARAVASLSYMARMLSDREGKPEEAEPLFRLIAESVKDDGAAWANVALALRWSGRSEEALATYEKAIEHAPEDAQIRNDLGLLLLVMGRDEQAARVFQEAHEADARHNDGLENLGFMAREKGDLTAAEKWFALGWRAALSRGEDGARHRRNLDDVRYPLEPLR